MRCNQPTGDEAFPTPTPDNLSDLPGERFTRVLVTVDAALVILLAFAFGFGNGWTTASRLGIDYRIAPLIQPGVDLAVIGLMLGIRYLAIHGWDDDQLAKPRRWLMTFGVMTLAMNTALPISEHQWGRAAWDAVGPVLLIAWSDLAPWLLRAIYSVRTEQSLLREPMTLPLRREEQEEEAPAPAIPPTPPAVPAPTPPVIPPPAPPANPPSIASVPLDERIRHFLLDWEQQHGTYAGAIGAADTAFGAAYGVTDRRVSQVCKKEWDDLHAKGLVKAPRPALLPQKAGRP